MKVTLRKKELKNKRSSYYLDIYHLGKRKYEFLNIYVDKGDNKYKEKKKLAENIRAKRELELANDEYGFIADFKKRVSLIRYFEKQVESKHKWSNEYNALKHLKKFVKGDIYFQDIDEKWLEKFQEYLLKHVSSNTALSYYMILKKIFKNAKKDNLIIHNVAENVKLIKYREVKRGFLTIEELRTLAKTECFSPEVKRAFIFSCYTGLRYSDICSLKWSNVKQDSLEIRQMKTQELLYIPLNDTSKKLISNNNPNLYHFPNKKVFDLPTRCWTNRVLKRWFKEAKILKNAHFHLGRHTFATMNITQGTHIYTVSKLLGHKKLSSTEIYSNIIDDKKKEAINKLPRINV
ncbi:tyrosine-type recombinase/integrase [Bacteroidota bacterium]